MRVDGGNRAGFLPVAQGVQPTAVSQRLGLSASGARGPTPQVAGTGSYPLEWISNDPGSNLEGGTTRGGRSLCCILLSMYIAFASVKNLKAPSETLQFERFQLRAISRSNLEWARKVLCFDRLYVGDWVYEREYETLPPIEGWDPPGLGRIPSDTEDTLLLLRLFRIGDLSFSHQLIWQDDSPYLQIPYRALTSFKSPMSYWMTQPDCSRFDDFASNLTSLQSWNSQWARITKAFVLYGGAKEFNPHQNQVDRIIDYAVALEASLVPERDFVGRRLRERAAVIIDDPSVKDSFKRLYNIRSTLVHGSPLSDNDQAWLIENREILHKITRKAIVECLRRVPASDDERKGFLAQLYDIADEDRAKKLYNDFGKISDQRAKAGLVARMGRRLEH